MEKWMMEKWTMERDTLSKSTAGFYTPEMAFCCFFLLKMGNLTGTSQAQYMHSRGSD